MKQETPPTVPSLGTFIFHTPPLALPSSSLLVHESQRKQEGPSPRSQRDYSQYTLLLNNSGMRPGILAMTIKPSAHKASHQTSSLLGNRETGRRVLSDHALNPRALNTCVEILTV